MTRESKKDFDDLLGFASTYDLSAVAGQDSFKKNLQRMHRVYIGLLTFLSELEFQVAHSTKAKKPNLTPTQFDYLAECVSDIGNALFCWIHGAYKPARLMLRSSIETFVKGTS